MEIYNPYKQPAQSHQSAAQSKEKELATASALTNMNEDICPKCGGNMKEAALFNNVSVNYCASCRVAHPRTIK